MDASSLDRKKSTFPGQSTTEADLLLGTVVRARRHALGKTLVEVATATELSHSFLSQLERGRARPSMRSLFLIAGALETTQQALLAAATPTAATSAAGSGGIRLNTGRGSTIPAQGGSARLLNHVEDGADVTEFLNLPSEFEDSFCHGRHEFVYVVSGNLEVELTLPPAGGETAPTVEVHALGPRQSLGYPGSTAHRHRRVGPEQCVVLVIHSGPQILPEPRIPPETQIPLETTRAHGNQPSEGDLS